LSDLPGPVLGDASQHIDSVVVRISLVQINYLKAHVRGGWSLPNAGR
jgi:hypothetical protein